MYMGNYLFDDGLDLDDEFTFTDNDPTLIKKALSIPAQPRFLSDEGLRASIANLKEKIKELTYDLEKANEEHRSRAYRA